VWITLISTLRLATSCSLSLTATRVTTRSLSSKKTRSRQHSSPPLELMPTQPCPSGCFGLKNAGATYSGPSNYALLISYTAMLEPTWTTWSSRPQPTTSSSLISRKPSTAYANFHGSLTQLSASSACHKENYSVLSLVTEQLKQTRRRSPSL
jgi:hypothetical protein